MTLSEYSDLEIEQEFKRRQSKPLVSASPIFVCERCGTEVYFYGPWNPAAHEHQFNAAKTKHSDCPMGAML